MITTTSSRGTRPRGAFLIVAIVLVFCCTSCKTSHSPNSDASTLDRIRNSKVLNVGYFVFPPTVMEDPNTGKLSGVFIDLAEALGNALDAKVVYHKVDLANFVAGLQARQYDLSIGATFATPQRATSVLFTRGIFYDGYTGVCKKGRASQYPDWQSLDRANLTVAVKQGSAVADFVRANFKKAKVIQLAGQDLSLPLAAVSAGQADVGLMNQTTVFTYLRQHPELEEILSNAPIAPTYYAWAVRSDDVRWLLYINTFLDYEENTGATYHFESKYGIPLRHVQQELVFPEQSSPAYWKLR